MATCFQGDDGQGFFKGFFGGIKKLAKPILQPGDLKKLAEPILHKIWGNQASRRKICPPTLHVRNHMASARQHTS